MCLSSTSWPNVYRRRDHVIEVVRNCTVTHSPPTLHAAGIQWTVGQNVLDVALDKGVAPVDGYGELVKIVVQEASGAALQLEQGESVPAVAI